MKGWYVFNVDNKRIGFLATNIEDALHDLKKQYGSDVKYEYVGIKYNNIGLKIDEYNESGVSAIDMIIANYVVNKTRR